MKAIGRWVSVVLWLALASGARGLSVEYPVTTNRLDEGLYLFAISTNAVGKGVAFRATITSKKDAIPDECSVGFAICTHTTNSSSVVGAKEPPPIVLKKEAKVWRVDFIATCEMLDKPGFCLLFVEPSFAMMNGKKVSMPAQDMYEVKLRDFVGPGILAEIEVSRQNAAAEESFRRFLANVGTNEIRCLWFLEDNGKVGMEMIVDLGARTAQTRREVYSWAVQGGEDLKLSDQRVQTLKRITGGLPASDGKEEFNRSVLISVRKGDKAEVFQYDRRHAPAVVRRVYDIAGGYF